MSGIQRNLKDKRLTKSIMLSIIYIHLLVLYIYTYKLIEGKEAGIELFNAKFQESSLTTISQVPNMIIELGTVLRRCGVKPPYILATPSSLMTNLKH